MDETNDIVEVPAAVAQDCVRAGYDHISGKFYVEQGGTRILLYPDEAESVVAALELAIEDVEEDDCDDEWDDLDDEDDEFDEDGDDEDDLDDDED